MRLHAHGSKLTSETRRDLFAISLAPSALGTPLLRHGRSRIPMRSRATPRLHDLLLLTADMMNLLHHASIVKE